MGLDFYHDWIICSNISDYWQYLPIIINIIAIIINIIVIIIFFVVVFVYHHPRYSDRMYTWQWRHNERNGVSNHQPHDCLPNRLFRCRSKKTSNLRVTGLCAGNSPVTGEFPAQGASNAENVSIWWRHHDVIVYVTCTNWYWYGPLASLKACDWSMPVTCVGKEIVLTTLDYHIRLVGRVVDGVVIVTVLNRPQSRTMDNWN